MKTRNLHAWALILLIPLGVILFALLTLALLDLFDSRLFRSLVEPGIEESIDGRDVQVARLDLQWELPPRLIIEDLRIANAAWGSTAC